MSVHSLAVWAIGFVLGWYVVLLRHLFATNGIDVGYAYYLQRCRVLPAIRSIDRAARACTYDDGSNRSQHFCLLIRQPKREPLGIFRERFFGRSSLSCLHQRCTREIADSYGSSTDAKSLKKFFTCHEKFTIWLFTIYDVRFTNGSFGKADIFLPFASYGECGPLVRQDRFVCLLESFLL